MYVTISVIPFNNNNNNTYDKYWIKNIICELWLEWYFPSIFLCNLRKDSSCIMKRWYSYGFMQNTRNAIILYICLFSGQNLAMRGFYYYNSRDFKVTKRDSSSTSSARELAAWMRKRGVSSPCRQIDPLWSSVIVILKRLYPNNKFADRFTDHRSCVFGFKYVII